jgi:hypothetical protein
MPDAGRTREPACKEGCTFAHASNDRAADTAGTPCAMGYGLYAVSSVRRAFWPPSPHVRHTKLDPSIGGPGQRDFAVRIARARLSRRHVHRIPPPTFVTIAKRPSWMERDGRRETHTYEKRKMNIVAQRT